MELEALKEMWTRHEEELMESTRLNHALMRKLLIKESEKRINWLKLRSLAGLALPPLMLVFIAATIEFRMEAAVIAGLLIFGSFAVLTYYWAVRFHVLMERIQMDHPIVEVKNKSTGQECTSCGIPATDCTWRLLPSSASSFRQASPFSRQK